ncbi:amidohydrolase family protein [Candidatus Bathyarchaeota archaeon]|jgi:5-methylthioadenosine/S-adenosylhomocysteine deaminase|nr:amidohydrolase family protein [Candidatus Bathyarchaeota archaeon]
MNKRSQIIPEGDVHIIDDRIEEVGENIDIKDPDIVLDAKHHLVMPGFVNAHSHLQQYFRGVYELMGDFFETNLPLEGYRKPGQMSTLGLASCAEFIYGGCTTSMVVYTYPDGYARAVEKAGNRCYLAGDIEHVDLEKLKDGEYVYLSDKRDKAVRRAKDLYYNWHGKADGRIKTLMCPKAPDMTMPEVYEECKEFALEHNLNMTTHLSQSQREYRQVKKLFGKTPPRHLYDLGIMNERLSGAHLTYATSDDTMLIQKTGMAILHCHSVESPLVDWIDLGIPIGLGTDDYFHNMNDLLREQRNGQAIRGNKVGGYLGMINSSRRTTRPSFYKMLELSTIGGAKALGLQDEVGSLEEGKKADIITFNLMNPYIIPTRDPITSVFLYATPGDIDNVICNGAFLKKKYKLTTVELNKALLDAQKTCDDIINKFFEEHPEQQRIWEEYAYKNFFN